MRRCLGPVGGGPPCPNLVTKGRCPEHTVKTTARGYGSDWQRTSKAARETQPWCSVCGSRDDLTLDHTTGMVVCRSCHRSEAQGGVARTLRRRGASESCGS